MMKAISTLWSILLGVIRFTIYPIHLLYRVIVRCFHLCAVLSVFFIIPVIIILAIVLINMLGNWNALMSADVFVEGELLLWIVSFGSLGGLAYFMRFARKAIISHIFDLRKYIDTFYGWNPGSDGWIPGLEIRKSISDTRQHHIMKILPSIKEILISSIMFNIASFLLMIALLFSYIPIKNDKDWKSNVSRGIDQLRSIVVFIPKGTTYPLVFPKDADIGTKVGICPVDSNFIWLKHFKEAISNCYIGREKPNVLVQGFSSVAPMSEDSGKSDMLNCEVANQRAEAVVGLLISELNNDSHMDQCMKALEFFEKIRPNGLCKRDEEEFKFDPENHNIKFNITYIPWKSYDDMLEKKPAYDGTIIHRNKEVEFLNRVVHITITNDACWRDARSSDL